MRAGFPALGGRRVVRRAQAQALYRTGRAQRLTEFLADHPGTWQARLNVHLAFRNAPVAQRLYLTCHLEISEYIRNWDEGARHIGRGPTSGQVMMRVWL